MRYHLVVWLVPDINSTEQVPIMDEEFDFHESRHKVVDIFTAAIEQAKAEGGQEGTAAPLACEPYMNGMGWWHTPGCEHIDWEAEPQVRTGRRYAVPGDHPERTEYDDDRDGKDMDPHYYDGEPE